MNPTVEMRITREVAEQEAFGDPMLRFFNRLMLLGHRKAAEPGIVPIDEGYLRMTLSPGAGVTEAGGDWDNGYYAQVGSDLDYGGILAESEDYYYASGPSEGMPLHAWLDQIIPTVEDQLPGLERQLGAEITASFAGATGG